MRKGDVVLREVRVSGKDKSPMVPPSHGEGGDLPSDLAARDFRLAMLQVRDPEVDVSVDRNGKDEIIDLNSSKRNGY